MSGKGRGGARHHIILVAPGDFTQPNAGHHYRICEQVDWAISEFENVSVYSYRNLPGALWDAAAVERFRVRFPGAQLVLENMTRILSWKRRLKTLAITLHPPVVGFVLKGGNRRSAPALYHLLLRSPQAIVLVNYIDGLLSMNGVLPHRVILDTHDSKYIRSSLLFDRPLWSVRSLARLRAEIAILGAVKAFVAISRSELTLFRLLVPASQGFLVPTFSSYKQIPTSDFTDGPFDSDLLFVGSSSKVNSEALVRFLTREAGWLSAWRFNVVGAVCENADVIRLASQLPNVRLLGRVPSLENIYRSTKVVVAPVEGTGLSIKILEALSFWKPVFASDVAISAFPLGSEKVIQTIRQDLIEEVLRDDGLRRESSFQSMIFYQSPSLRADLPDLARWLFAPEPPAGLDADDAPVASR